MVGLLLSSSPSSFSVHKYLLRIRYIPGPVLGAGDSTGKETNSLPWWSWWSFGGSQIIYNAILGCVWSNVWMKSLESDRNDALNWVVGNRLSVRARIRRRGLRRSCLSRDLKEPKECSLSPVLGETPLLLRKWGRVCLPPTDHAGPA